MTIRLKQQNILGGEDDVVIATKSRPRLRRAAIQAQVAQLQALAEEYRFKDDAIVSRCHWAMQTMRWILRDEYESPHHAAVDFAKDRVRIN